LVVAGGVEDEFADQGSDVAVEHADVEVVDEHGDFGDPTTTRLRLKRRQAGITAGGYTGTMGYELVISSGNNGAATDTPSGVYPTRLEAMEALKEAAKVDGLTVR